MVGLAPTKDNEVRLIYSQVLLLLSHTYARNVLCFLFFELCTSFSRNFKYRNQVQRSKHQARNTKYKAQPLCGKKQDEGRENNAANTLRGTLLLRMATLDTLRKRTASSSVEGSLPSSLAKRYFECQKTKGAGFKPPREATRSFNSREFCFEIWERESAPADYCLILRLSMAVGCPSLAPK